MWFRLVFLTGLILGLLTSASAQDRTAEIWDHVDSRIIREMDQVFDDGDFPFVVALLKIQLAYEPNNYDTLTNLGWMLENVEEYTEAEALYRRFLSDNPTEAEAAYPLGWFLYTKKRYEECIKVLAPTINYKRGPHPNTYRALAKSYERLKQYSSAIAVWKKQLIRFPDDGPAKVNIERVQKKINSGG